MFLNMENLSIVLTVLSILSFCLTAHVAFAKAVMGGRGLTTGPYANVKFDIIVFVISLSWLISCVYVQ